MLSDEVQQILSAARQVLEGRTPCQFGPGFSERALETPWVASFFKGGEQVLDIGFTMSSLDYLGLLLDLQINKRVVIEAVDIVKPERVVNRYPHQWRDAILSVPITIGDIRRVDLPELRYDIITCISTIEHIGFDEATFDNPLTAFVRSSTAESVQFSRDENVNRDVICKLYGTLKPNGLLLISVPMGKGGPTLLQDSLGLYCAQWEYNAASWNEIVNAPGFEVIEQRFGRLESDGRWCWVNGPTDLIMQSSWLKPHAQGVALVALRRN